MKTIIKTDTAPAPIGPYNQAVKANGFVFVSGQLGIRMSSGELITGNIREETQLALTNVRSILEAAGSSLDKVVKVNIYLKNMDDFAAMNEVYGKFFSKDAPARAAVEVSRLPKDVSVEIECIATE